MKQKFKTLIILAVMLCLLAGCGEIGPEITSTAEKTATPTETVKSETKTDTSETAGFDSTPAETSGEEVLSKPVNSTAPVKLSRSAAGEYGYYMANGPLIYFFDYKTNQKIVLCNKPNCAHNSLECSGYISAESGNDDLPSHQTGLSVEFMFYADGELNLVCGNGEVLKMNFDGSNHRRVARIEGKYGLGEAYMQGKAVYINAFFSAEENYEVVEKACFLVYDTESGSYYQSPAYPRSADSLLGVFENCAFYFHRGELSAPGGSFEENVNAENRVPCAIYKIDLSTGEKRILCEKTAGEIYPAAMLNGKIYCHSREKSAICGVDVNTGELSVLAENITGQIIFGEPIDGNLVFLRSKVVDALFDPENEVMEFFNTETNTVSEAYRLQTNIGWNDGFRGILASTPDSYIMIYKADFTVEEVPGGIPAVTGMVPYVGIIKKADFWSGNYNFTEISWF